MTSSWELSTPFLVSDVIFFSPIGLQHLSLCSNPIALIYPSTLSPRCAVGAGEWDPAVRGLQKEVLPEARRVLCG